LFAGYGMYFNEMYYLGAEVFGAWSGASSDNNISVGTAASHGSTFTNSATYSSDGNVGIDVIPGIKLNPATLAYVRLGYNWADLQAQDNVSIAGAPADSNDNSNWEGGFHWGVGLESAFYENWSVRAEYTYTSFSNLNNDTASYSSTFEGPSDNQFMVGVLYHFV